MKFIACDAIPQALFIHQIALPDLMDSCLTCPPAEPSIFRRIGLTTYYWSGHFLIPIIMHDIQEISMKRFGRAIPYALLTGSCLIATAASAQTVATGDSRTVTQPTYPTVCTTLTAQ